MNEHTNYKPKTELLTSIEDGYQKFEALLAPLSDYQQTIVGVNGIWSIKDNLAHLSAWHQSAIGMLQAVQQGYEYRSPWKNMSFDEANAQIYQESRDRSLQEVRNEFRATYQALYANVLAMTEESLNRPIPWRDNQPIWFWIVGNSYEHYQEHGEIIQNWLTQQPPVEV